MTVVQFVEEKHMIKTYMSIIAMSLERYVGCCATSATGIWEQ